LKDSTSFSIFEKEEGGNYTKLALLYQDILKFSVVVKEGSPFKEREMAKWLLYNNQYYINYYRDPSTKKTNENNRVEYILDRIKDKLDDLIKLGYLESDTAPAEKGLGNVRICKSTGEAELTQCIIESIDPNKRQKAYDTAYNILQTTFNIDQSSLAIFDSKLYKKYKDRGLFGEFVVDRLRESFETTPETRNTRQLRYTSLVIFHTNDPEKNMLSLSLWEETFSEINSQIQELMLYNMKHDIEHRMMHLCKYPKAYEEGRYNEIYRRDIKRVILEGYCKNCDLGQIVVLSLLGYIRSVNSRPNDPIVSECPQCKKNSLKIPIL
jgi:hypothetical protein